MRLSTALVITAVVGLICNPALAGDLRCHVTKDGADVAGVDVTLTPGGTTLTAVARGTCVFTGLAAGKYRVEAQKTIGEILYLAIVDEVVVPATGEVAANLPMGQAIRISDYLPVQVGNYWQYHDILRTATAVISRTRRERATHATHTTILLGDRLRVIEVTWPGTSDVIRNLVKSSSDGYAMYGEGRGTELLSYNPPLLLPNLLPMGYTLVIESTIKHHSSALTARLRMECTFTDLMDVTVPAGTFEDCVRLECKQEVGGQRAKMTWWLAKDVGRVRALERKPGWASRRTLEEYKTAASKPASSPRQIIWPGWKRPLPPTP